jgi:hypothetical protein
MDWDVGWKEDTENCCLKKVSYYSLCPPDGQGQSSILFFCFWSFYSYKGVGYWICSLALIVYIRNRVMEALCARVTRGILGFHRCTPAEMLFLLISMFIYLHPFCMNEILCRYLFLAWTGCVMALVGSSCTSVAAMTRALNRGRSW